MRGVARGGGQVLRGELRAVLDREPEPREVREPLLRERVGDEDLHASDANRRGAPAPALAR